GVVRTQVLEEGAWVAEFSRDAHGRIVPRPGTVSPELSDEASVYRALVLGVRDYVEKHGFPGVVMGLSGGVDSALTLAIAVDALGKERVQAVMMPSRFTSSMSLEDARQQAQLLGVKYSVLSIEGMFETILATLKEEFAGRPADATEENIQSRCRMVLLMALSNKTGRMLLTTGNKSEMAVGYATLYGDMAGGFAPIKDCSKLLVYRLANYRNSLGRVIPARAIEREPSAELRAGQKDSDALPPYEVLDPILEAFIEEDLSVDEIEARGFDRATIGRVLDLVKRNEYKRRQAPPGVRVSRRAFGRDWRYPITSGHSRGRAAADAPEPPPGFLPVRRQRAPIGGVVGRINLAALLGERLELHVVVALDQQVERRLNRRRPVVLFYRTAGSLRGRDVGTALVVVPRDVHLVA